MNKQALRVYALERAEFMHDLWVRDGVEVWEHTMYEWLFVWAAGEYLS